ncbi:NarK family nitrate/nitrite MFS transporter [Persicirhabdus sediminis]|uniref:Nitrate/nitrite transporter n=1 Tax=Persicirhabdus sediminis TaxID=454144 RepID=A0A8J7MJ59_9BACT|nr:NarK family nitrate/nitrite MFS transporter [Persicirhabdus sediminis]MBK1791968.1 NarK family nitrate/nitrite MFS transporter [Persicirhabdus sediminis]
MSQVKLNVLAVKNPSIRTLHFTWIAFFITFMVWFNHAPLGSFITEAFNLTKAQWKALLIVNVALTIPARIIVGILVDRFGPRLTYSILLFIAGITCIAFSLSQSYEQLAITRFLMGFTGAGFVIGIRMVGEWFPARQVGLAEGIYGGWGNFGSAASAMIVPSLATFFAYKFGGEHGWRYAIATTGLISMVYSFIYYANVRNTPKGATYFKPKKAGGLEVSTRRDFYFLLIMNIPMYLALGLLAWKLSPSGVSLISTNIMYVCYAALLALFIFQVTQLYKVNKDMLKNGVPEMHRYPFRQVAILNVNYFITFGSELAVVSMLPFFFIDTFGLDPVKAGMLAAGFAFMNLVARPAGGLLSDKFGRRVTMQIFMVGLAIGYFAMSQIGSAWPLALAVGATMMCSFFVQSGEGAVFAMVPLIQRRMTGQIAGMTGAYGNVGAVVFLTAFSFVDASTFFLIIAATSAVGFVASMFLNEPKGHMSEVLPDGSVELIEVG